MNGLRELTVTTLYRASARHGGREQKVPYLRISGRWLEQYGLTRGCHVIVSGEPEKLVLMVTVAAAVCLLLACGGGDDATVLPISASGGGKEEGS